MNEMQVIDVHVPLVQEETVYAPGIRTHVRVMNRTVEPFLDMPVPVKQEIVNEPNFLAEFFPPDRISTMQANKLFRRFVCLERVSVVQWERQLT